MTTGSFVVAAPAGVAGAATATRPTAPHTETSNDTMNDDVNARFVILT